jgi:hypothetical protein
VSLKRYLMQLLRGMSEGSVIATCALLYGTVVIFLYHYIGINGLLLAFIVAYVGLQITRRILKTPKS